MSAYKDLPTFHIYLYIHKLGDPSRLGARGPALSPSSFGGPGYLIVESFCESWKSFLVKYFNIKRGPAWLCSTSHGNQRYVAMCLLIENPSMIPHIFVGKGRSGSDVRATRYIFVVW